MKGLAKVRQFNLTGDEVALYENAGPGDVRGPVGSTLTAIAIPLAVTLAGSYLVTKWAYPRDFTFFKWIGVPLSIGILGLVTTIATGAIVSEID